MARRYLFLTQTFPRFAEDIAGPFIRELALGLQRLGDQVTVLVPHAAGLPEQWDDAGLEVRSFRYAPVMLERVGYGRSLEADEKLRALAGLSAPLYLLGAAWALRRETRRRQYDLVHAHWLVPNGWAAWVNGWRRLVGQSQTPFAIGLHGSDVFLAEKPGARAISARALARAALLTGCSAELVDRALAVAGSRSPRDVDVIPYGVDVEAFSPSASRSERSDFGWRQRLGVPRDAVVALGVGRMATKKGFQVLIEALPALLERFPSLCVVLAGGGDREADFRNATAAWSDRVLFPGSVPRNTLPDLYRAADIFVLPAVHDRQGNVDGLPNVILEAMASGLPVVASGISGIPLAITSGTEGLLVPEADPTALTSALASLVESVDLRLRLGAAARRRAVAELTWDVIAGRYRRAYLRVLQDR